MTTEIQENTKLQSIVSKPRGEKGTSIGVILRGRFPHNDKLLLRLSQKGDNGAWVNDPAETLTFASGKTLALSADGHFLNVYSADEFEIVSRGNGEEF